MSRFQGVGFPKDTETRKMGLDLLDKINTVYNEVFDYFSAIAIAFTTQSLTATTLVVSRNISALTDPIVNTVVRVVGADSVAPQEVLDSFGGNGVRTFRRANGTNASKSALLSNDTIGSLAYRGYGTTGYSSAGRGAFSFVAAENWTDTAQGTFIGFNTCPIGTTSILVAMRIGDNGVLSSPRGALVASAATITPTGPVFHVTGVAAIGTINVPANSNPCPWITIIPDGIFTWTAAGNIALAGTAVVSKAVIFTYDSNTSKWYPSYV